MMAGRFWDPRGKKESSINIDGAPIEVVVGSGSEERRVYVHEYLIRSQSHFFEAALSKDWQEGVKRIVRLPEDDADVFQMYVLWLYTNLVYCITEGSTHNYMLLAKLYVLGEKLMDSHFQDRVLDAFIGTMRNRDSRTELRCLPDDQTARTIYDGTPAGSPARKLMVDIAVSKGSSQWMSDGDAENRNHEFLFDLATALLAKRSLSENARTSYWELESGVPSSYYQAGKLDVGGDKKVAADDKNKDKGGPRWSRWHVGKIGRQKP